MNTQAHKKTATPMDDPHSSKAEAKKTTSQPLLQALSQAIRGWLRHSLRNGKDSSLKEVLEEAIEEHEDQGDDRLAPEERIMLHNVLTFGDTKVSDIMVPRTDICAVPIDIEWINLNKHITEMRHTRIPVYHENLDRMKGFIHVKDLLPLLLGDSTFSMAAVLRPLLYVPPSMRIIDLLVMMRQAGSHMAIVVDEYGGTDGLVTMEDLFEEIVGDIQDEHDDKEESDDKITHVSENIFEVNARISIEALERELGLNLITEEKEDEFDTLGGLVFFQLGRVPARGEIVRHISGIRFEIVEADPRRIRRIRILTSSPSQ